MGGDASLTGEMDDMRTTAPPGRRVRLVRSGPYTTLASLGDRREEVLRTWF